MSRALKTLAIFFAFVAIVTLSRHAIDSSTTTTTVTSSTTTTVATTSTVAVAACQGSDFRGVYNEGEGAAGTIYASVTLTKTTAGTCAVDGWPILTLSDRAGAVLPSSTIDLPTGQNNAIQFAAGAANRAPARLTLADGAATNFSLAYSDVGEGTAACANATTVSVALHKGQSTVAVTPQYPPAPCNAGTVWVSPFY